MQSFASRTVLAGVFLLAPAIAALGQQAGKGPVNPRAEVENATTYNERGIAKKKEGNLNGALADFNRAIRLDPLNAVAYNNRARAKQKKAI